MLVLGKPCILKEVKKIHLEKQVHVLGKCNCFRKHS